MISESARTIAYVTSLLGIYLAAAMLAPMAVDWLEGNQQWKGFLVSAFLTGSASAALFLASRGEIKPFNARTGFLLVSILWIATAIACAIPFLATRPDMSIIDAAFEAASGVTTTGATVLTQLDQATKGILLWRSTMQWLGGIGIVAMGMLVLPFLRIGGMQFFRMESSEHAEKPVARIKTFAISLAAIYVALTLACMTGYAAGGMKWFDAINHAMTTVATAGFSTSDSSFAQFGNGVLVTAIIFMLLGAMPFTAFFLFIRNGDYKRAFDSQIAALPIIAIGLAIALLAILAASEKQTENAAIHASFNLVSILTTTGYSSSNYAQWGNPAIGIFLIACFIGGCAGSTSGGFKIYRIILLFKTIRVSVRELVYPNGVFAVHYNDQRVSNDALRSVTAFFFAYVAILFVFTALLAATGLDFTTAFSGTLAMLSNVGPGLGEIIGPAGNYQSLPDAAKCMMILLMLLGRLEIMTLLVVLSPVFWRSR